MMAIQFMFIALVFWKSCLADHTNTSENYQGSCGFPCNLQDRIYERITDEPATVNISSNDPTVLTLTDGGNTFILECYIRFEPFGVFRLPIEGNDTHARYRCYKRFDFDTADDVLVLMRSEWKTFPNYPSLCDVCDGDVDTLTVLKDVEANCTVVFPPEVGCNIPLVCPVTNENQVQCECPENTDNGFCCDKDEDQSASSGET